jgi:hypothetical protein
VKRLLLPLLIVGLAACGAAAQSEPISKALALQIALEREGFSPGLLDGKPGLKTTLALRDFQKAHGLSVTGRADEATREALDLDSTDGVVAYTISAEDEQKVTGPLPTSWNDRAAMDLLGYVDLADAVAERFHTKLETLQLLNPSGTFARLRVGQSLKVPAAQVKSLPRISALEINLSEKTIRAFDRDDVQVALFHCSIARDKAKRPAGEARVSVMAMDPNYTFDPKMWPEVHDVERKLTIAPGPRNPVGMAWIGLSLPGYGIHGTPVPALIGKTGSHGCFRLTNWDAVRLAKAIRIGVPIRFLGEGE